MRTSLVLAVATVLVLAGCSESPDPAPHPGASASSAARWLVDGLNGEGLSTADRRYFSSALSDGAQWPEVTRAVRAVVDDGPWEVVDEETEGPVARRVLRSSAGRTLLLHLERGEGGAIDVLWFGPAVDRSVAAADVQDVRRVSSTLPVRWSAAALRVGEDRAEVVGASPEDLLPMASVAKVVVAAGVARGIDDGRLSPRQAVLVESRDQSAPVTASTPAAGERRTIDELVALMLQTSDNTATDALLRVVGPDGVTAAWEEATGRRWSGPFLSTKQVLQAGWGAEPLPAGSNLGDAETREVLRRIAAATLDVDPRAVTTPRWQDGLDWTARSTDIAALGAWLLEHRGSFGPQARAVLDDDFTKAGGAPGVVAELRWTFDDGGATVAVAQFAGRTTSDVGDAEGLLMLADRTLEVER